MVQPKYVSCDRGRKPALWWYPTTPSTAGCRGVAPALYATLLCAPARGQLGALRFGRLWRASASGGSLLGLDKLF
jgi:hypothetical protein